MFNNNNFRLALMMPAGFWILDGFSIDTSGTMNTYKDRRKDISNFDFFPVRRQRHLQKEAHMNFLEGEK